MQHGLSLNTALLSLTKRGKTAEATALKKRVTEHFKDVLTEEQILQLPIEELTGVIEIFNNIYPQKQKTEPSPLEAHIDELKRNGHFVIYGAGYHGKR